MDELSLDTDQLLSFENQLDPARPAASGIRVLGNGRFSTVFEAPGLPNVALKRFPPYPTSTARAMHERALNAYQMILRGTVGLNVARQRCVSITNRHGEHVLYIAQEMQPYNTIGDRVLRKCTDAEVPSVINAVLRQVLRVWHRNEIEKELDVPGSITGLDAQLSNWSIVLDEQGVRQTVYLDTGTPFFRRLGRDLLEPDLLLGSVPLPLVGLVRQHFVRDVLDRYYDLRRVVIDFVGGFYAMDQAQRVPLALDQVNAFLGKEAEDLEIEPLGLHEVEAYARRNERFWKKFLTLSRIKRFGTTRILRQKYNFSLPV
jgi:hypothetical protein